jgi:hypothetical protein
MSGTISTVQVRLNGLTHTDPDNLDMVLVSPDGTSFVFWSDVGGVRGTTGACPTAPFACSVSDLTITVADTGAALLPDSNPIDPRVLVNNTTYRPSNNGGLADVIPDSGVTVSAANSAANSGAGGLGGTATFTNRFGGSGNVNGEWRLYIALDGCCGPTGSDPGSLTSWSLILTTNVANAATTTSLTSTVNPSLVGNNVTITSTVTAGGNPVTLGSVSFFEGAQALQTNVPLNASGQASFTTSALAEGSRVITANYSGATGFGASSGTLTQVVDRPTTVSGNSFCNVGPITIPNTIGAAGTPYPSKLFVTGLAGTTQKITMDLRGFTHPVPEDVNLLLVSPTGQRFVPFGSVAGIVGVSNIDLTLDDAAASLMPSTGALPGGTYRPSAFASATFPAPAPAGPYQFAAPQGSATFISTFSGASPNGTWQLFAASQGAGTAGPRQFGGGWCLNFTTSSDPATTTTPSVSPSPSALGQSVTVSALVANAITSAPVNGLGTVNFTEGSTLLAGPLPVNASGVASFTKSDFTQGARFLTANYNGSPGSFGVSNGTVLHYVDAPTTNPSARRYCNLSALTFPNAVNASGTPYPTRVRVSDLPGTVSQVTVELNGLSHQFPDDLDLMLSGPNGNSLVVFSDVGGGAAVNGLNLVLDSSAAQALPDGATLSSGTFRPTDFQAALDTFAAPAPTTNVFSASVTSLPTAFGNINPNGMWTLFTTNDSAGAQGGGSLANGWCLNFALNNPDLTISKSHVGNFTQGQIGAQYSVVVGSLGPGTTSGTITVVDTPTSGLSITAMSGSGWNCTVGTATCTTTAALASGGTLPPITVTVNVAANATSPQVNTVTVSAPFDPGSAGNNTAADSTIIVQVPDLRITKSTSSSFVQGGTGAFSLVVNNSGAGASSGAYTISDSLPTGLTLLGMPTGSGWDCSASTANLVSCVRATSIAALGSAPAVTFNVNVATNAPASITNTATVAGGGEVNTGNNSGSVTFPVTALTGVTVNVPAGVSFTLNSVSYTGSQTVNLAPGTYVLATTTPQTLGAGTRAVFSNWSNGGAISQNITVGASPLVITGNFTTQHQLTTVAGTGGTVSPASGSFFDAGTVVNVTATANSGFSFANWSGPVANATAAATTVTMSAPASVTANFTAQTGVTINVPAGVSYTFNGQTVTGSQTFQVAPGTYTLSTTTPQTLAAGTRAVFSNWSNGGAISQNVVVGSSALTITGTFTTQHQLTTAAGTGGTVTPASGSFFDAGTVVNVTATPSSGFSFANWSGPVANAIAAATTVTMSAPASVTANFTAQTGVTINVPAGVSYTFNGQTVTGSQTFQVAPGTYTLSTTTPQTLGAGTRAVFSSWSNGGAISQNVVVGSSALTITGTFTTQHQLTTAAGTGGTVTPASGSFFDAGTVVNVTATASSGFNFASWTGPVANATAAATTVTMSAPASVTANFTAQTGVTINVPAGVSYTFNGQTVTGSQTFQVAPGTYTLSTTTPQTLGAGTRAVFASWSNGGAISQNVVVGSSALTITGTFTTQHQLTTAAGTGGTVTPASGSFFDAGTVVNVSATASSGFNFASWTGPVANATAAATTVTMSAPATVTANFSALIGVTVNVPAGVSFTLNGVSYTGSQTVNLAPGTYVLATTTPQTLAAGTRAVFSSWSNGGAISQTITVGASPLAITGNFTTQHQLTTVAGTGGTVSPASGSFFDAGTVVNVTATANSGFSFANWSGPVANATAAATTVTMSAPATVTANFSALIGVTVNVPAGVSFTLNGVSYTGSQTVNLAPGTYVLATTTPQTLGAGTRVVFSSWSNGGPISQTITVGASPLAITANFTTQHQLTTVAGTGGTVTPASGSFFDAGTVVNVTATPSSGFSFANWSGPVANPNAAATTVTMSAPATVIATFNVSAPPVPIDTGSRWGWIALALAILIAAWMRLTVRERGQVHAFRRRRIRSS